MLRKYGKIANLFLLAFFFTPHWIASPHQCLSYQIAFNKVFILILTRLYQAKSLIKPNQALICRANANHALSSKALP